VDYIEAYEQLLELLGWNLAKHGNYECLDWGRGNMAKIRPNTAKIRQEYGKNMHFVSGL
jgi:hypothetical protein